MKEYKFVQLNDKLHWTRGKDLAQADQVINEYVKEGWQVQQIISPNDLGGAIIALLFREKDIFQQ